MTRHAEEFEQFVAEHSGEFLRLARLLVRDPLAAEDLVQRALTNTFARWGQVRRGNPVAYVRTAISNGFVSSRRLRSSSDVVGDVPDRGNGRFHDEDVVTRLTLRDALATLPPKGRAVIVLRYLFDLPDDEIARTLGIRPVTVRSHARNSLAALRARLPDGFGALDLPTTAISTSPAAATSTSPKSTSPAAATPMFPTAGPPAVPPPWPSPASNP